MSRGDAAGANSLQAVAADPAVASASQLEALHGRLIWILGSPRTGSSWLMRLLAGHPEVLTVDEPYVGLHVVPQGEIVRDKEYLHEGRRAEDPGYLFARRHLPVMAPKLRELVLLGLSLKVQEAPRWQSELPTWLVVKEPNGSHASDTIISLLPRSRMIFLLRDGRDVVDSLADAVLGGKTWWKELNKEGAAPGPPRERTEFLTRAANTWVFHTAATRRAFDQLPPERRLLVRYEHLLADTAGSLLEIYRWLGIDVAPGRLRSVIAKHDFSNIPSRDRGPGKGFRAATPGLWRENMSEDERAVVERIMGPTLRDLGYPP